MTASAASPQRVVVYTRAGCHLCAAAEALVAQVCAARDEPYLRLDVDTDPALAARWGDQVPVVTVDGAVVGFWRIDAGRLVAALAPARPRRPGWRGRPGR